MSNREREEKRMKLAERWVSEIMQPILASGLIETLLKCSRELEGDGDLEWLEDALVSDRECDKCDGDGMVGCDHCSGTGYADNGIVDCQSCDGNGEETCPHCEDGRVELDEIYEYWLVDEQAERRLHSAGETLINGDDIGLGCAIWCRRTTGQVIYLDSVVQRCAEAFAIDCPWWSKESEAK